MRRRGRAWSHRHMINASSPTVRCSLAARGCQQAGAARCAVPTSARERRPQSRPRLRRPSCARARRRGAKRRAPLPSLDFPAGAAVLLRIDVRAKTPIEYEPRVERLCRRHPEMGPCQYERNQCRAKAAGAYSRRKGEEVTMAVEAEYDRVVRRVRFQGDGGGAAAKKNSALRCPSRRTCCSCADRRSHALPEPAHPLRRACRA